MCAAGEQRGWRTLIPYNLIVTRLNLIATRFFAAMFLSGMLATPAQSEQTQSRDRYISVRSNDPAIAGQRIEIYVRERAQASVLKRGAGNKVVLFVHGAGTPAEVSFDVPFEDYSWMAFLAAAGYDVFSVDMTGYGRSFRPPQMANKCNLSPEQQKIFGLDCPPSYPGALTNILSDWNDIGAAVDFIRKLRHVAKLNLIGWSQGGPRAGGWAALHPERVASLVLLAPAYNRGAGADAPKLPVPGPAFNVQSYEDFMANWNRQAPCVGQYDPAAAPSVWAAMLQSDPVGAGWMPAVRRAPISSSAWGWTATRVGSMNTPTLLASGVNDAQVNPQRVRDLYADLGSTHKMLINLGCASHNAMWEKNHALLFKASLEWLDTGTVNGRQSGILDLGN